jgi:multisubunit Na+/H+ antiporter MnhB subunit
MGGGKMSDENIWKKRFFIMTLARLTGTVLALLGMAIAFGNLVEPGGSRFIGVALVVAGLVIMAIVPRHLSRRWRRP